jgi:hypothetical protein
MTTSVQAGSKVDTISENVLTEISLVMACLIEAETLAICIEKAQRTFCEYGILGEVIVADNGRSDGSITNAQRLGAQVVRNSMWGAIGEHASKACDDKMEIPV